ncbi:alpha/beta fold hydrolase [Nocardia stercoris]|uniref:Alpha/beta hydrolase n=1 Tax=Nocardia stercoris TaxID=2483361 RepID=A0A3M2L325_9NOCA|nr:alpha/beta hydrolase [Nocardia stercoris]RMI31951.1 alpha/beta hydrolase [Nocardia stercoris]
MTSSTGRHEPITALHTGAGDPLLLLHPFMLSPHCWHRVATRLSDRCEVFAPALAGHWGGPPLNGRLVDTSRLADVVEGQLDELGWRTCHIAGNSLGGWVAFELARRGRARTLTAIAPAGGWNQTSVIQYWLGVQFLGLVPITGLGRWVPEGLRSGSIARRAAGLAIAKHFDAVPPEDLVATITAATNCAALLPLLAGSIRYPGLGDLRELAVPTRLLMCEYDRVIPNRRYARHFLRNLPESADRILVNGVGHVPMLEAPDRIAALIAEHMQAGRPHLRAV